MNVMNGGIWLSCWSEEGGANRIRNSDCVPCACDAKLLMTPPVA